MKEISVRDIKGIRIGQSENADAGTGCTVIISESGAPTGLDVRGGGPASRESRLFIVRTALMGIFRQKI
ncbi:MAG: hypothetical protein ACI4Q5_05115 [Porcipelethomonas sp.]